MKNPTEYRTKTGRVLADAEIEEMADDIELAIDVDAVVRGRRGRPPLAGGPAEVVPIRLDPSLRAAVEQRALADQTTTSDVIREAIRKYLNVA